MELLLEINTEEMPRPHVESALEQMSRGLEARLKSAGLVDGNGSTGSCATYGTCRRLILTAEVAAGQRDTQDVVIGPPRSAAFRPDGTPGPAALGFARSRNIPVEDLEVISTPKGEYAGIRRVVEGRPAHEILIEIIPDLISRLTFPKMMRWGDNPFRFSRPIQRILCLLDGKILPFQVGGVESGDVTQGHRLYAPREIRVTDFSQYRSSLRGARVLISREARRQRILKQIAERLKPYQATYLQDDELLDKLSMDVEYPYVFIGSFPERYLKLPLEVLSTAMREGQNLFSVVQGRKQLSVFVGVSDGCADARGLVRSGNERVLKARLEDARFFWENDLKVPLKQRSGELSRIVFQEKLGSYADKSERIRKLAVYLAGKLDLRRLKSEISTAAEICKADLLTEMVREFPSLQGKAGGLYARKEGYPSAVWKSIYEQYIPVSTGDPLPATPGGAVLSASDKLDTVIGVMGLGVEISGSKDPFGLRRHAQGICAIFLAKKIGCSFPRLVRKAISSYENRLEVDKRELETRCLEFFKGRMLYLLEKQGFRSDLVQAALSLGLESIPHVLARVKALHSLKDSAQFAHLIQIAKRVNNILRDCPKYRLNPELLSEKEERELYTTFSIIRDNISPLIQNGDYTRAQRFLLQIRSAINSFFDSVLVMDEDSRVRKNRLALLLEISRLFNRIADYSLIQTEAE